MIAKLFSLAFISTFAASAPLSVPTTDADTTAPGSIFASLKRSSLNNIMQLMAPLLANEMIQGKGFVDVLHKEFMGVGINVDAYNITTVSSNFDHSLLWKEGANDTLIFTFSGFDINGTLEGNVTGLPGQKCTLKEFNVVNISVVAELALPQTDAQDGIHWQIVGRPQISLGALELKVKQFTWQIALNKVMPMVVSGINYGLSFAEGIVEGLVWNFNQKLASGNPEMLVSVAALNADLNLTTPRAPSLSSETDLIQVWLDGRFINAATMVQTIDVNTVEPVRNTEHKQFDQIFVHQSMVDSALFALYSKEFDVAASEDLQNQLVQIFYELEDYYGKDFKMTLDVSFVEKDGEPVQMSTENGFEIGNIPEGGLNTNLAIMCTNATTTTPEMAMELNLDVKANVNASFNNFVIYGSVNDIAVSNTKVVTDNIGLDYHAYDDLFTSIAKGKADTFNIKHAAGIDLAQKISTLKFIAGMAQNSIATPFEQNEFLYAGFKWISDW